MMLEGSLSHCVNSSLLIAAMSTTLSITLQQYDLMIERGVFDELRDRRIELIRGEICEMSPPGPTHEDLIDLLSRWSFQNTDPNEVRVRVQNSIGLPELESAPQPDVAWVREQSYREGRPKADDVLLVVEVSDSSLAYDRNEKAELYAEAGIKDYWIVNAKDWCVEVYRDPANGQFREKRTYDSSQTISPLAAEQITLSVRLLFPA